MPRSVLLHAAVLLPVALACGGGAPRAVEAEPPPAAGGAEGRGEPSAEEREKLARRVASLVKDLGHDEWNVREAAAKALIEIGAPAEAAIEGATRSGDLEISTRAWRLLLEIRGTGFIGIYIADGPEPAKEGAPRGSLVTGLVREGAPDAEGLRAGDVVVTVNGGRVDGYADLQRLIARCRPGSRAKLRVRRKDKVLDLVVEVERWPEDEFPLPEIPD